jgi:hypothetical protein
MNEKIFIGKSISMNYAVFKSQLDSLNELVNSPNPDLNIIEQKLMEIVPTFHRKPLQSIVMPMKEYVNV